VSVLASGPTKTTEAKVVAISLRLPDLSVVRIVCSKSSSTYQVDGQVLRSLAWNPAFEMSVFCAVVLDIVLISNAALKVDLNLKRTERWLPNLKLAHGA
jgi:hypothetical protein